MVAIQTVLAIRWREAVLTHLALRLNEPRTASGTSGRNPAANAARAARCLLVGVAAFGTLGPHEVSAA